MTGPETTVNPERVLVSENQKEQKNLQALLWLGLLFHILAVCFSEGFYQGDEQFQILEFANTKLNSVQMGELPWEFDAKIRSWFLPAFFYGIFQSLKSVGLENPFVLSFVARMVSSAFGFYAALRIYRHFFLSYKFDKVQRTLLLVLTVGLFYVPFFHARTSGENWSGALFFLGWVLWREQKLFWAGLFMGFAFEARFQVGFLILGAFIGRVVEIAQGIRTLNQKRFRLGHRYYTLNSKFLTLMVELLFGVMGLSLVLGLGRALDYWGYGEWVLTPFHYFKRNLIDGEAARHGTLSVAKYIGNYLLILPPLGALLFVLFFRGLFRSRNLFLVFPVLMFMGVHLIVAHKEVRFLFPLLYILPPLCVLGLPTTFFELFKQKKQSLSFFQWSLISFFLLLVALNSVALVVLSVKPAKSEVALYKAVYSYLKNQNQEKLVYYHVGDDPLRYAGLRPQFYLPFQIEGLRLKALSEFKEGILIASESNIQSPEMQHFLENPECKVLWHDFLYRLKKLEFLKTLLRITKYRYQVLVQCQAKPLESLEK